MCVLCHELILPTEDRCTVHPCGHGDARGRLHYVCIADWFTSLRRPNTFEDPNPNRFQSDLTCPVCRRTVLEVCHNYQDDGTYTTIDARQQWPEGLTRARARPAGAPQAGAPQAGTRPAGAPQAGARPAGARPAGARPAGARPAGARPAGARPAGPPPAGARPTDPPPPPPSPLDQSMRDSSPTPAPAPRGTRSGEAPFGWVYDEDRSDTNCIILKKVVGVFSARNRGYRLLLKSDSRNPAYPDLPIYDLEAQYRFPGKKQEWQDVNGEILQPAPRSNLEGKAWEEFNIMGVANVWQNLRVVDDRVQMPLVNAECIVRLEHIYRDFDTDWYKISDVNAEFGAARSSACCSQS